MDPWELAGHVRSTVRHHPANEELSDAEKAGSNRQRSGVLVAAMAAELQEIPVRITAVNRHDGSASASTRHRPIDHLNATGVQVREHGGRCCGSEEAEVCRSRRRDGGLGLVLATDLVQVDLLRAEREGPAALAERDLHHAEHACVERRRGLKITDGEDEMVDGVDMHIEGYILAVPGGTR